MADLYYIDLEGFSLERLRHTLETGELIPGRMVLKEQIAERFEVLKSMGITNLGELIEVLKTKKRLESFARESGLPEDYLVILRREANSYMPKPVTLKDIPGVSPEHVEKLESVGIKHTKQMFERAGLPTDRAELSSLTSVPEDALLELVKLSDLARIWGAGPVFVRLFYEAGADTIEKLAECSPEDLFERLHAVNDERGYTKIMGSLKDVRQCIEMAKELPKVVDTTP